MKKIIIYISLSAAIIFSGCTNYKVFDLVDKNHKIEKKSIAVISGGNNPFDINLSIKLSKYLNEMSDFRVIGQQTISKRYPSYPMEIVKFEISKTTKDQTPWLPAKTLAAVSRIQRKIGANYILLVWTEDNLAVTVESYNQQGGASSSTTVYASTFARLIEYPSGKVKGYSAFRWSEGVGFFGSMNKSVDRMLDEMSWALTDKLVEKTGRVQK